MFRTLLWISPLFVVGTLCSAYAQEPESKKGRLPSIRDIMQESHKCRTAHIKIIADALAKPNIDWATIESKSNDLILAGKLLALNQPPKGSLASWEKKTTLYVANSVLMTDAAERKNKEDTAYHVKRLRSMCSTCHLEHK